MATLMQTATYAPQCSSSAAALRHLALPSQSSQSQSSPTSSSAPLNGQNAFAFVRIHDDVCLVHADASLADPKTSSLTPVELAVFRHEFGTMFRLARRARLPSRDVQLLAPLDDNGVLCDADSGVVFLAREMTNQLLRFSSPSRRIQNAAVRPRRRY